MVCIALVNISPTIVLPIVCWPLRMGDVFIAACLSLLVRIGLPVKRVVVIPALSMLSSKSTLSFNKEFRLSVIAPRPAILLILIKSLTFSFFGGGISVILASSNRLSVNEPSSREELSISSLLLLLTVARFLRLDLAKGWEVLLLLNIDGGCGLVGPPYTYGFFSVATAPKSAKFSALGRLFWLYWPYPELELRE